MNLPDILYKNSPSVWEKYWYFWCIFCPIYMAQQQCIIKYADFMHFWVNASISKSTDAVRGFSIKDQSIGDAIAFFYDIFFFFWHNFLEKKNKMLPSQVLALIQRL